MEALQKTEFGSKWYCVSFVVGSVSGTDMNSFPAMTVCGFLNMTEPRVCIFQAWC